MTRLRWAGAAVVVALVASITALIVTSGDDEPGEFQARLAVDGQATVTDADGEVAVITGEALVAFGDEVTLDEGSATLTLRSGASYELRAAASTSRVLVGLPPVLLEGDILLAAGFPTVVRVDTATLSAQGALKVSFDDYAAAYAGRARVDGLGALDEVPGLRQASLRPSATLEPFTYDGTDAWDRRFLGDAMAFGDRLEALARGYTANLAVGGGRTVSFFEAVLPALRNEREFGADLLDDDRAPGETLIGAAIAVQGRSDTFRERWQQIFAFRDAGAAWGIVALDQGVSSAPLLDTIELAIDESPLAGDPRPSTTTTSTTTTTSSIGPEPTTTSSTTTTTTTTTTPPDVLDPVLDPVQQLLDDVLDALGL